MLTGVAVDIKFERESCPVEDLEERHVFGIIHCNSNDK
jgi:hypothetical protein